jgi:ribosome-binding protein aMBF1 (putative translation factor)
MEKSPMTTWDDMREEILDSDPEVRRIFEAAEHRMHVIRPVINARAERGWSQRQLAQAANMSQPAVARFESGDTDPRLSTIQRLYCALDIDAPPINSAA